MAKISDFLKNVQDVQFNPHAVQRVMTRALKEMSGGRYEVFEPSNPFVFALETATALATAGIQRNETLIRRQYPELAQTYEDLYPHMSDEDYLSRFAKPNEAEITMLLSYDELLDKAVDSADGVRKIVIPADTVFSVDGIDFVIVYPVEIRLQPHGGMQIVYDASIDNPLYTLATNVVDWRLVNMPDQSQELAHLKMVMMKVKVLQLTAKSHYDQLNSFSGFAKEFSFIDQYHHARVYMLKDDNSEWVEISTTHSDQVYDTRRVAAVLNVADNKLSVSVPSIYFTRNMVYPNIRVDIFSTKGPLNLSLARFTPNSFDATWEDKRRFPDIYSQVIGSIDTMLIYSESILNGGSDGITFEDLRQRVINNSLGRQVIPITPIQIENRLKDRGFDIIKDIDHITNRLYVATRGLETPSNASVSTPVGCTIQQLKTTIERLAAVSTVKENHERLTIESGTLFESKNGILTLVSDHERNALLQGTLDNMVATATEREFLYNPIHYVIDRTNRLRVRSYYLDDPAVVSKEFIAENPTTGLEVITLRYGMSKTPTGFKIVIYSKRSDETKELVGTRIKLQLRYKPNNEQMYATIDVPMIGTSELDEMLFEADLHTRFDITADDQIVFNNFTLTSQDEVNTYCPLDARMELVYIIEDYFTEGIRNTEIDRAKATHFLSEESHVITHEAINVHFGYRLKDLWDRSRVVVDEANIMRYDNDIPHVWPDDQYERDPVTGSYKLIYDEDTQSITAVKTASKGDPIIFDGVPQIKHRAGDPKLDGLGNPIPLNNRSLGIVTDLLLFEGAYYFADERSAVVTRDETVGNIVSWVVNDMPMISDKLLENTEIMFKPKQNIGWVDVYVNNATMTSMSASQRFNVKVYMTATAHDKYELRADLERMVKETIVEELEQSTISVRRIGDRIKARAIDGVIDVSVNGLGGDANYDIVSTGDASVSLSLAKKLAILSDQTITVQDDVNFEYIKHTLNDKK